MATYLEWLQGDPDALEEGRKALEAAGAFRDGADDLRSAVQLWQKRHGLSPSGHLTAEAWAELVGAEEPRHAAEDGQNHEE